MEKSEKEKNGKELGLVVSQQTVIRNQAKTQLPQNEEKSEKGKKQKRIRPRRVPTDGDSESGQNSAPSKTKKIPKKEKNEKELGRTDGRFEISRSKSPYPQILVPNGPL